MRLVRCILSWGRALGPLGGLSTGQLNCCLPRMEEKKEERELHLALPHGVTPRNFAKIFDTHKTRMIGLPYGEEIVTIC